MCLGALWGEHSLKVARSAREVRAQCKDSPLSSIKNAKSYAFVLVGRSYKKMAIAMHASHSAYLSNYGNTQIDFYDENGQLELLLSLR